MVTSIVAYWLPSPKRPRSKDEDLAKAQAHEIVERMKITPTLNSRLHDPVPIELTDEMV